MEVVKCTLSDTPVAKSTQHVVFFHRIHFGLQGNVSVTQVETSPEILLVYRAHLVMIAHKILAASTPRKDVKKLPKVGMYSWNSRNRARRPCA
jgi:hypothetical protein